MKLFLIKLLAIVVIGAVPVWLTAQFDNADRNSASNENIVKLKCKSDFDSLDVLFVGNSYTYSGIDLRLLDSVNVKAFNLGLATAGPFFYDLAISDYFSNTTLRPKTIFLLISPLTFSRKSDNFAAYPIHRYLDTPYSNEEIVWKYGLLDEYSALLKKSFEKGYKNLTVWKQPTTSDCGDVRKNKGFVPSATMNDANIIRDTESLYKDLTTDSFNWKKASHLLKLGDRLTREGIHVVYYSLPTNMLSDYLSSDFMLSYRLFIEEVRQQNTYISLELPKDNRYFRNIDHLNSFGALKTTQMLLDKTNNFRGYNFFINDVKK